MDRRTVLGQLAGGLAGALLPYAVNAQSDVGVKNYPSRPIRFVVPFPPGGGSDAMARLIANAVSEQWGATVVVFNKPGGSGVVGTETVANESADGYTWLLATFFHVTNSSLNAKLSYDTIRDFNGVATISKTRYVLVARSSLSANSVQELIALAKAEPGKLTYGSAGVGGGVHLAGALFNKVAGTKMLHVPYRGAAPLMQDIMGGVVDIAFQTSEVAIPALASGKVKALAVTGDSRIALLPQVPTFAEAGVAYDVQGWFGIVVRAGTPQPIIDKINVAVAAALQSPKIKAILEKTAVEPFISSPSEVDALIKADVERYGKLIKEEGIKPH